MSNNRTTTTGYRLVDGRYFIVKTTGGKVVAVRQTLFGCGIYPAPAKDVPEQDWPEVLASIIPLVGTEKNHSGDSGRGGVGVGRGEGIYPRKPQFFFRNERASETRR